MSAVGKGAQLPLKYCFNYMKSKIEWRSGQPTLSPLLCLLTRPFPRFPRSFFPWLFRAPCPSFPLSSSSLCGERAAVSPHDARAAVSLAQTRCVCVPPRSLSPLPHFYTPSEERGRERILPSIHPVASCRGSDKAGLPLGRILDSSWNRGLHLNSITGRKALCFSPHTGDYISKS